MPLILAVETSTEWCSVALARPGNLILRHEHTGPQSSARVLPMVAELLDEAGVELAQCDAVAFGAGPGAFTGLRTACGIAQGLAYGASLPVVQVNTLEACAEQVRAMLPAQQPPAVLVAIDARMDEAYWAVFRLDPESGDWLIDGEIRASAPEQIGCDGPFWLAGNALEVFGERLVAQHQALRVIPGVAPNARAVASLALRQFAAGRTVAPHDAAPLYVRNKVALTTAERELAAAARIDRQGAAPVPAADA